MSWITLLYGINAVSLVVIMGWIIRIDIREKVLSFDKLSRVGMLSATILIFLNVVGVQQGKDLLLGSYLFTFTVLVVFMLIFGIGFILACLEVEENEISRNMGLAKMIVTAVSFMGNCLAFLYTVWNGLKDLFT